VAKEQQSYRRYDEAFKREAVQLTYEAGRTVAGVARDLGISENNLWRWRQRLAKTGAGDEPSGEESAEAEVQRLRRELARVTQERDILKKALAYFSRSESGDTR
jgi:transposase